MQRIDILGIPIDCISQNEALKRIAGYFRMEGQFHVLTPNPEMIVEAQKNEAFRRVLKGTALNLPDGVGLVWAMKKSASRSDDLAVSRVTGTDTMQALCDPRFGERIFLLGAAPGIAEKASAELLRRHPKIQIVGTFAGSPKPEEEESIIERINAAAPTLLFVAYGAPVQDLWIARNLAKMKTVKVAMGVGGAFDFIAGKQKRAPKWMRSVGLEWLWRLITDPRRIGRIWNAVIVFPLLILTKNSTRH